MNKRALLCAASLALGLLPVFAAADPSPAASDTPAVALVRRFLADRASGSAATAYALLDLRPFGFTEKQYAATKLDSLPDLRTETKSRQAFGAVEILFIDSHNAAHYAFTIIGPDPASPDSVLVSAVPPPTAKGGSPLTVRVAVVAMAPLKTPRLNLAASLDLTAPDVVAKMALDAKRDGSRNNLRYISLAISQYQLDHDGKGLDAAHWVDQIAPYAKDATFYHDPSAPSGEAYSYAFNSALSGLNLDTLQSPKTTVLLFESTQGVKNASDTGQSVPQPGRHEGGTDYLFADGHVQWFPDGTKPSFKTTGK